jgi:hypothetical protein
VSHAVYGIIIALGIVGGVIALASTVATAILIGHKREMLQRDKDRKLKEVTHIREQQAMNDVREHEIVMQKLRSDGSVTGKVVDKPTLESIQPNIQPNMIRYRGSERFVPDPYVDGP